MHKFRARVIAVLLIPCFIADPSVAAAHFASFPTPNSLPIATRFSEDALSISGTAALYYPTLFNIAKTILLVLTVKGILFAQEVRPPAPPPPAQQTLPLASNVRNFLDIIDSFPEDSVFKASRNYIRAPAGWVLTSGSLMTADGVNVLMRFKNVPPVLEFPGLRVDGDQASISGKISQAQAHDLARQADPASLGVNRNPLGLPLYRWMTPGALVSQIISRPVTAAYDVTRRYKVAEDERWVLDSVAVSRPDGGPSWSVEYMGMAPVAPGPTEVLYGVALLEENVPAGTLVYLLTHPPQIAETKIQPPPEDQPAAPAGSEPGALYDPAPADEKRLDTIIALAANYLPGGRELRRNPKVEFSVKFSHDVEASMRLLAGQRPQDKDLQKEMAERARLKALGMRVDAFTAVGLYDDGRLSFQIVLQPNLKSSQILGEWLVIITHEMASALLAYQHLADVTAGKYALESPAAEVEAYDLEIQALKAVVADPAIRRAAPEMTKYLEGPDGIKREETRRDQWKQLRGFDRGNSPVRQAAQFAFQWIRPVFRGIFPFFLLATPGNGMAAWTIPIPTTMLSDSSAFGVAVFCWAWFQRIGILYFVLESLTSRFFGGRLNLRTGAPDEEHLMKTNPADPFAVRLLASLINNDDEGLMKTDSAGPFPRRILAAVINNRTRVGLGVFLAFDAFFRGALVNSDAEATVGFYWPHKMLYSSVILVTATVIGFILKSATGSVNIFRMLRRDA